MTVKRKVLFLTGAAATGKTSVIDRLKELYEKAGLPVYIQLSITRNLYKNMGVVDEKAIQLLPEDERIAFQMRLLDAYIKYTLHHLNTIDTDAIIDRFVIDYLAWTLYVGPGLTKSLYYKLCDRMTYFIDEIKLNYDVNIAHFPFPTPWTMDKKDNSSDGFRFDPFGKNLTISYIINGEVRKLEDQDKDVAILDVEFGTPEQRAEQIFDIFVGNHLPTVSLPAPGEIIHHSV